MSKRMQLVVAVAVTFVFTSVAAAIAADQFIDGNLSVTGNIGAQGKVSADGLEVADPIFYEFTGEDGMPVGTLGFGAGNDRRETLAGEFPELDSDQEYFMFTQIVGGPRNLTISTKYQPNRGSFLIRLSKPAPASGVRFAYHVVTLGAP